MVSQEHTVTTHDLTLAVKTWGNPDSSPILALHGWQDNAATFDKLAPQLPDLYWVIPDLPGHGLSHHRGIAAEYSLWHYGLEAMAVADAMGLEQFVLVGHSMGGGVSSLLAALFPDRIKALVLLDVIGVITTPASDALEQMRTAFNQRLKFPLRRAGIYKTREEAVTARARRGISEEAAALLGSRGISRKEEGYYWQHDQRLTRTSLLSLTEEHGAHFLEAISCPVLLITSKEAVFREDVIRKRMALVKQIRQIDLPGGHHQHLDGDVETIAEQIQDFLTNSGSS